MKRVILTTLSLLFLATIMILAGCSNPAGSDSCSVVFNLNYENQILSTETLAAGNVVSRPDAPNRVDYCFCGWYTDKNLTDKYDFSNAVSSDLNLYARWLAITDSLIPSYTAEDDNTITITGCADTVSELVIPTNISGCSVKKIKDDAFRDYYDILSLDTVEICFGLEKIGEAAFQHIDLKSIIIPDSVVSIGANAFYDCGALLSVEIGDGVTAIGGCAFWECTKMTSLTIGSSVTTIGQSAFYACSSLTSITLPASVTSLGKGAVQDCSGLTSFTCKAENPPVIGGDYTFDKTNNCPIYVPSDSVSDYQSADFWKDYKDRITSM